MFAATAHAGDAVDGGAGQRQAAGAAQHHPPCPRRRSTIRGKDKAVVGQPDPLILGGPQPARRTDGRPDAHDRFLLPPQAVDHRARHPRSPATARRSTPRRAQAMIKQLWAFRAAACRRRDRHPRRRLRHGRRADRGATCRSAFANGDDAGATKPERRARRPPPPRRRRPEPATPPPTADDDDDDAPPIAAHGRPTPSRRRRTSPRRAGDEPAYEPRRAASRARRAAARAERVACVRRATPTYAERGDARTRRRSRRRADGRAPDRDGATTGEPAATGAPGCTGCSASERQQVRILAGAIAGAGRRARRPRRLLLLLGRGGDDGVTRRHRRPARGQRRGDRGANPERRARRRAELRALRRPRPDGLRDDAGQSVRFDSDATAASPASRRRPSAPGVQAMIGPGLAARLAGQTRPRHDHRALVDRERRRRHALRLPERPRHQPLADGQSRRGLRRGRHDLARAGACAPSPTGDYLLIEPGIPGDGTGVDIQSIKIDLLAGPESCAQSLPR